MYLVGGQEARCYLGARLGGERRHRSQSRRVRNPYRHSATRGAPEEPLGNPGNQVPK